MATREPGNLTPMPVGTVKSVVYSSIMEEAGHEAW